MCVCVLSQFSVLNSSVDVLLGVVYMRERSTTSLGTVKAFRFSSDVQVKRLTSFLSECSGVFSMSSTWFMKCIYFSFAFACGVCWG